MSEITVHTLGHTAAERQATLTALGATHRPMSAELEARRQFIEQVHADLKRVQDDPLMIFCIDPDSFRAPYDPGANVPPLAPAFAESLNLGAGTEGWGE